MGENSNLGDEVKGSLKKVAGQVTGSEDLEREGEAQRTKADKERAAEEAELEAEARRQEAKEAEAQERRQQ